MKASFSLSVKDELLESKKPCCCALSLLSAMIHTGGSINISSGGLYAEISTENEKLALFAVSLLKTVFGAEAELRLNKKSSLNKNSLFSVCTPYSRSEEILNELGIIKLDENNHRQIIRGIDAYITEQECCKKSYITGAFLCCGSISIPSDAKEKNAGYICRFTVSSEEMAEGLKHLIEYFGINAKVTQRRNNYIVYIKESESIGDLLALMDASKSFLRLTGVKLNREVKNNTNRQTNCIVANIDKTISAAMKQLEAINIIERKRGLNSLEPALRVVAETRKNNPEASLENIAALCGGLTKSGINHRMRKIVEISKKL